MLVVPCQGLPASARALKQRVEAWYQSACRAQHEHNVACQQLCLLRKVVDKHMPSVAAGDSSKREYQLQSEKSLVVIFVKVRTGYSSALAWMDPGARYVVLLARSYQQPRRKKEERLCE